MSDSTVPAIDAKQTDQESSGSSSSSSASNTVAQLQWGAFLQFAIGATLVVVIYSVVGANFVTLLNFEQLSLLLPVDEKRYYRDGPSSNPKPSRQGARSNTLPCRYGSSNSSGVSFSLPNFDQMGINGNAYGWPYSMYKKGASELSFHGFLNWFANTTSDSYIWLRQTLIDLLSSPMLNLHPFLLFILANVLIAFAPAVLPFIASFIILPYKGFTNGQWGWMWTLLGLFWVWTPMMMGCNMVIQYLQVLLLFLVLPLLVDLKTVKEVLRCNTWWISIIFGWAIAYGGMMTLGTIPGAVMIIAWAIMAARIIIKRLNR